MNKEMNEWQQAIDDELVVLYLGTTETYPDPKEALRKIIDYHIQIALDPAVSSDAQALVEQGKKQAGGIKPLHATDIYDFAGWLTTRPGVMHVGSTSEAWPMAEAVGEYIRKFPEKFAAPQPPSAPAGLRVAKDADGSVWLHVDAPSGKKASICLDALAVQRGGIVGAALLEWTDSFGSAPQPPSAQADAVDALRLALDALSCTGESDDPGHRCGHCDDYVDRNAVVRQRIRAVLAAQGGNDAE